MATIGGLVQSLLLVACLAVPSLGASADGLCSLPGSIITFQDEFEGSELNTSNWAAAHNRTHGPDEQQLYLDDDVFVTNGTLVLRTRKRRSWHEGRQYNFTSGWVESKGKRFQQYGVFEVRARLPSPAAGAKGFWPTAWPAHWLMPEPSQTVPRDVCWPVGGEIDIMEGYRPRAGVQDPLRTSVLMTYHWANDCNEDLWNDTSGRFPDESDSSTAVDWTDWHTFSLDWQKSYLRWYIDGVLHYERHEGDVESLFIPQFPFYMILNTALTPWADANRDTGLPIEHVIDRVTWCKSPASVSQSVL